MAESGATVVPDRDREPVEVETAESGARPVSTDDCWEWECGAVWGMPDGAAAMALAITVLILRPAGPPPTGLRNDPDEEAVPVLSRDTDEPLRRRPLGPVANLGGFEMREPATLANPLCVVVSSGIGGGGGICVHSLAVGTE